MRNVHSKPGFVGHPSRCAILGLRSAGVLPCACGGVRMSLWDVACSYFATA
jgi:hypothetical protein